MEIIARFGGPIYTLTLHPNASGGKNVGISANGSLRGRFFGPTLGISPDRGERV